MFEEISKKVKALLIVRILLWVTAFGSTAYWIWYSFKLTADGIVDPYVYASMLRPVMYLCILIAVAAVLIAFALYRKSSELVKKMKS
ncbi:MAG: hypothetical protein K5868_03470 [Lachnospiraceae bacterium]|nr:hypothetical protein [Lachnospiraceae bacterium]